MNLHDTEALRQAARGNWAAILAAAGIGPEHLRNRHGPCPGCGGTDRFRFDDKAGRGTWICGGGKDEGQLSGDGFALLNHALGWPFREAAEHVRRFMSMEPVTPAPMRAPAPAPAVDRIGTLRRLRSELQRIDWTGDDPATAYLRARGLAAVLSDPPEYLRLHPGLAYWHGSQRIGTWPAIVAAIVDADGEPAGLHRTYLEPDGRKACAPGAVKKMTARKPGSITGAAVRLYAAEHGTLAITEGIETALAIRAGGRAGCGLWAALSAHGLQSVDLPDTAERVEIWADHDPAGIAAARALKDRCRSEGRTCDVFLPPEPGTDWLDVLTSAQRAA